MLLFLHNYAASPNLAMKMAGYHKRHGKGDWIREEPGAGRFHFKTVGFRALHLHFDIYLADGRHYAPHLPLKLREEMHRIHRRLGRVKTREMKEAELLKLVEKYK